MWPFSWDNAAAPIGNLRWRAPQPLAKWTGVRAATEVGAACPQATTSTEPWARVGAQSEDCLFLNIWTPSQASSAKLPVMFFIHGGSFRAGAGGVPLRVNSPVIVAPDIARSRVPVLRIMKSRA